MELRNMTLYSIFVRNHGGTFAAPQLAPLLSVDQRLQIGAAAGDQNCDFGHHSRITFSSSFLTMVPMT